MEYSRVGGMGYFGVMWFCGYVVMGGVKARESEEKDQRVRNSRQVHQSH